MPIIWLGDSGFEEDVTDGDIDTNARLNIGRDDIFENYVKLRHGIIGGINKDLVLTSTVLDGYTRFNWQNAFGSTLIEYGVNTDKITLVANSSSLNLSGNFVNINSLANTNIKLSTLGSGILDVDINAEFKGYLRLPAGTTGQRPTVPQIGMIRFNTDLDIVEAYYNNSGTPEWRELCTDCGTPVGDSIGIVGDDIVANADGSPASNTISISGGNIDASADGSPVSSAELTINGSNYLAAQYNTPTTLYLNYAIAPTGVDPTSSNVSVDQAGLSITMEPSLNRIKVITSASTLGKVYKVTVTHPNDSNVKVVWTITLVNSAPTPTPTSGSGSGAGPTPTPTSGSGSGAGPTPTPTSGSGAGPTPTPIPATAVLNGVISDPESLSYPDAVDVYWTLSDIENCTAVTVQTSLSPTGPWGNSTGSCTSPRRLHFSGACDTTRYFRIIQTRNGLPDVISNVYTFTFDACGGGGGGS